METIFKAVKNAAKYSAKKVSSFFEWFIGEFVNGYHGKPKSVFPDIQDDVALHEWISNQTYVARNLIAIVVRYPTNLPLTDREPDDTINLRPEDHWFNATGKALFELHPWKINGLFNGFYLPEHPSSPIEIFNSTPFFYWSEKYGKPINGFFQYWRKLYEQYTKSALNMASVNTDWIKGNLPNYTFDIMFIEPDPTHTVIAEAWLVKNMYPKRFSGSEGMRDVSRSNSLLTQYEVSFHGETIQSEEVDIQAQDLLSKVNITSANPYVKKTVTENEKELERVVVAVGISNYESGMNQ